MLAAHSRAPSQVACAFAGELESMIVQFLDADEDALTLTSSTDFALVKRSKALRVTKRASCGGGGTLAVYSHHRTLDDDDM